MDCNNQTVGAIAWKPLFLQTNKSLVVDKLTCLLFNQTIGIGAGDIYPHISATHLYIYAQSFIF
ncbi:hypothetical protein BA894_19675 [Vibrio natriegens]|nr:hypothetical protein BA894_19675 [Vibrio natriegens]